MGQQRCGGRRTLETRTSLWTTSSQARVTAGGRGWRLVPYVGCRIDWEETESHLLAFPSHSKVGPRPVKGAHSKRLQVNYSKSGSIDLKTLFCKFTEFPKVPMTVY